MIEISAYTDFVHANYHYNINKLPEHCKEVPVQLPSASQVREAFPLVASYPVRHVYMTTSPYDTEPDCSALVPLSGLPQDISINSQDRLKRTYIFIW